MAHHGTSFVETIHHATYDAIDETSQALSCRGQIVFITGGGRGIGLGIAKSFATANAEGIFLVGRDEVTLISAIETITSIQNGRKCKVLYAQADITDAEAVSAAFDKAVDAFGRIDILIQNTGYLDEHRAIVDSDLDDFWRVFEVNVKGGLNVVQKFLHAKPSEGSTIINVGSGAGHISYIPGYSAYSASKIAFAKIIEYLHHENAHLRVFNINPGAIETDMQRKAGDILAVDDIGKQIIP